MNKSFNISEVITEEFHLKIEPSLSIDPIEDESGEYFTYDDKDLGMYIISKSIEGLKKEAEEDLVFLYKCYASEKDYNLSSSGIQFKKMVTSRIKKI